LENDSNWIWIRTWYVGLGRGGLLFGNLPVTVTRVLPMSDPFEALGDSNRREILRLLSESDLAVGQLADALPISRPAVSRHLRLLKEAGMVSERAEGTRRIYQLQGEGAQAVQQYLETVWGVAVARFRLVAENTERP
jgi:DNA-binding transcriptional ArsR family regulator